MLAVNGLRRTDKSQSWITKRNTILRVPTPQHGPRNVCWNATNSRAVEHPSRWRKANPGLTRALRHVLDIYTANPVREKVVRRTGLSMRSIHQAELLKTRQKLLLVLVAKNRFEPHCRICTRPARHQSQDQPREIGVIQFRDCFQISFRIQSRDFRSDCLRQFHLLFTHAVTTGVLK